MPDGGEVICTEGSAENCRLAESWLGEAGLSESCRFNCGDALDILSGLDGDFDLIFCDIDKHQYPEAFEAAFPRVRVGGLLVADNTLWSGGVLDEMPDKATAGIQEWNRLIYSTPGLDSMIVPLRDGVSVSLRRE